MNLIISSEADSASINLRDRLLEMSEWEENGIFDGRKMWNLTRDYGGFCKKGTQLITIEKLHIYAEGIDRLWKEQNGKEIDNIVFLSRHKAASGRPSLTVHPIGNWGEAEYGGKKAEVSGAAPEWMTGLLLKINENRISGYDVCFEATHHGPLLETPTMFLEIGSSETEWEKHEPAKALIKSLLDLEPAKGINVIGIGGGHYTPRFTEAAFSHEVCFGHMVANYGVNVLTSELIEKAIKIRSYEGDSSTGTIKFRKDISANIDGRDIIIVEDIIDSGFTINFLVNRLRNSGPKSVSVATILFKKEVAKLDFEVDYVGFEIPSEFVVGYGLDYDEKYRHLKDVMVMEPEDLETN